jgi:transposase
MSKKKEKSYSSEFKEASVQLAIESSHPIAQTAKELGVNKNTLYTWVDKYSKPEEKSMRTDEHIYDEVKRLKKELNRVRQERDLLKKAAAYFARDSQ